VRSWWYNYRKAAARKALLDAKVQQADVELAMVTVFRPPPPPFQIKLLAPSPSAYESTGRGGGYMPTDDLGPAAADGAQGDYASGSEDYETESEQGARR